jgi:amidase
MSAGSLLAVGRSMLAGATLAVLKTPAGRLDPLAFAAFDAAIEAAGSRRLDRIGVLTATASIAEVATLLAAGELSATELTLYFLARIRRHDPVLRSIIELNPEALAEAGCADERRRTGATLGVLDGIPVTLKDNIETAAPMHTTAGAAVLAGNIAAGDAPVVAALRAAGAVILGKANLSELAGAVCRTPGVSAVGGATGNPFGGSFSPGGSSSGSAVAVAAGLCLASVGTETSGSLLAPAAFNGVVGMKPSRGLVSGEGIVPLVRHQDSAGPIARSVADAALILATIATGPVLFEPSADAFDAVRVGLLRADILAQKSPLENVADNPAIVERITTGLLAAGANVIDAEIGRADLRTTLEAQFTRTVLGGLATDTMGYLARAGAPATTVAALQAYNLADPRRRMPKGQFLLNLAVLLAPGADAYDTAALAHREQARQILDATFATSGVEVLASLTNLHSTLYATAGYPAITVPLGLRSSGMPVGVTLIGRPDSDGRLLAFAGAFEQATRLRVVPQLR